MPVLDPHDIVAATLETTLAPDFQGPQQLPALHITYLTRTEARQRFPKPEIAYGWSPSPFGDVLLATLDDAVCWLAFADSDADHEAKLSELQDSLAKYWKNVAFTAAPQQQVTALAARIFPLRDAPASAAPIPLLALGTEFQIETWKALQQQTAKGALTYYEALGPARAVGGAMAENPLPWLIPCHRVLAKNQSLGGYSGGLPRKKVMIGWERRLRATRGAG